MRSFKASDRNQPFLLPPSIQDWLPKEHLARFIVEIVEQLDLSRIYGQYNKSGKEAYDPKVMLSLLFYGYATGIFSSRKIERATYDSVAFRYISANTHPDHDTIANFRKRFLAELTDLFVQILSVAQEMGVLKVGKVSLDGTKIKANASKHKALSYAHATKLQKQLEDEVQILLQKAKDADNQEDNDGMNIPDELARRKDRLEVIKAAKEKIEQRANERYKQELQEYEAKIKKREDKEQLTGKKPRGKKPQPPKSKEPNPKEQINLTDEESRIMPISGGGYMQAYNAQASVEHESRLIVHQHVTQNVNDKREVLPTLQWFKENPTLCPTAMLADAGYFSDENVKQCTDEKITPCISFGKEQHNQPLEDRFQEVQVLSEDATDVEKMKYYLQTKEGKELYALRKSMIEPIFGVIKHVMGFRQFMLRGFEKAKGEWNLMCIAYNLKRLHTITV
jgi:transposase/IS5 family transposase